MILGTAPIPQSNICSLAETQLTLFVPGPSPCGAGISRSVAVNADQEIRLFIRRGQRVAVENGEIAADFASGPASMAASVSLSNFGSPPLPAGRYFIAIANCGTFIANYAFTPGPTEIAGVFVPVITSAGFESKDLLIFGRQFQSDAFVLIDGERQQTEFLDPSRLLVRRARKKIDRGQTVLLIVSMPSGCSSTPFALRRR
jgi:hypothetical protein